MNTVGVNGLRRGLSVALGREGTKSVDPNRGGYAGHRCGGDAWGGAGACGCMKYGTKSEWGDSRGTALPHA